MVVITLLMLKVSKHCDFFHQLRSINLINYDFRYRKNNRFTFPSTITLRKLVSKVTEGKEKENH